VIRDLGEEPILLGP